MKTAMTTKTMNITIDTDTVAVYRLGSVDEDGVPDVTTDDLDYYISVSVVIGDDPFDVACSVGVPQWEQGSARASGAYESYGTSAWWEDSSDWMHIGEEYRDAVLNALIGASSSLFRVAYKQVREWDREERARNAEKVLVVPDEWYDGYGWHLSTERAGDIVLQVVSFDDVLDNPADVAEILCEDDENLSNEEAMKIAEKAIEIHYDACALETYLQGAIDAYRNDDDSEAKDLLEQARSLESEHGDTSSVDAVRKALCLDLVGKT